MRRKVTIQLVETQPKFARDSVRWHVRVRSGSKGQIRLHSENYATKSNARRAARRLVEDLTFPGDVNYSEVVE